MTRKSLFTAAVFSLCLLSLIMVFPSAASAHPPKDVQCSYDPQTKKLTVVIIHGSPFPSAHYIKLVEIKKNGVSISRNEYKEQSDQNPFTYTYTVEAAAGDTLTVDATCNIYGSRSADIKISKISSKSGN